LKQWKIKIKFGDKVIHEYVQKQKRFGLAGRLAGDAAESWAIEQARDQISVEIEEVKDET
jgi:hypothetical protein